MSTNKSKTATTISEPGKGYSVMKSPLSLLWLVVILVVMAVPIAAPSMKLLFTFAMAKGLGVLGVTVLLRAGQVSFGHALYFGIAAYAGAFLMAAMPGMDILIVLLAGVIVLAYGLAIFVPWVDILSMLGETGGGR